MRRYFVELVNDDDPDTPLLQSNWFITMWEAEDFVSLHVEKIASGHTLRLLSSEFTDSGFETGDIALVKEFSRR